MWRVPQRLLIQVTDLLRAHRAQDWERLRELVHREALIGVFAAGGTPVDVETAISAMSEVHTDTSYRADVTSLRALDDHAVILEGAVTYRRGGRFVSEPHAWLYVFVDGLLHRSQMFASAQEAQASYLARGLDLGYEAGARRRV